MSIPTGWRRLEHCILDGEPFVMETLAASGGWRVRIRFEEGDGTLIEDDTVWPELEAARGRAYQMADEHIQASLH